MVKVFEFESYKEFVLARIKEMPHGGRGQSQRLAEALGMHTTLVSQILRGSKNFSLEQATLLCDHFGLGEYEAEFFLVLVQLERAGSDKLRARLRRQLDRLRERSNELVRRLPQDKSLKESDRAIFYSDWYYSGIRLLASVPGFQDPNLIAERLGLSRAATNRAIEFLLATGLCEEKEGRLAMGPARTHLEGDSPLVVRHHVNWRLKSIENLRAVSPEELAFTGPMSVSKDDLGWIRKRIVELLETLGARINASSPETTACLNIDLFRF